MIVMDLEWNRGYDAKPVDEILQIGAVRVDGSGAIRDTFSVFIKPAIHKKFDRGARSLPDLESSRESDVTFPEAWGMFEAWRGDDDEFAFWGSGDFEAVRQNCAYYGLSFTEPAHVFDFQAAFSHALGEDRQQSALWRVVEYLGIPDTFTFHNALNDSVYTALVGMWLGDGARYLKPAPEKPGSRRDKFCSEVFPVTRGRRIGPFVSLEACLDSKAARITPCPSLPHLRKNDVGASVAFDGRDAVLRHELLPRPREIHYPPDLRPQVPLRPSRRPRYRRLGDLRIPPHIEKGRDPHLRLAEGKRPEKKIQSAQNPRERLILSPAGVLLRFFAYPAARAYD